MITVAGGTGRLGTEVVRRLAAGGSAVRVLTRDPRRAGHLSDVATEVVEADVRDPATLGPAVAGSRLVVSLVHGFLGPRGVSPETVDRRGNAALVEAAATAGADVVMASVVGAAPGSRFELFAAKYAAEQHLRASGVPWTIVRSTAFLETWMEISRETATRSGRPVVPGHGTNPINFVSVRDVAELVCRAVEDAGFRARTLEIGGPENLSLTQLAVRVAEADGRRLPPRHLPVPLLRLVATTIGRVSPQVGRQARAALAMDVEPLDHDARRRAVEHPDLEVTWLADLLAAEARAET